MMPEVQFILRERFGVGESPVWDAEAQRLLWCDIPAGVIHALHPKSGGRQRWQFDQPVPSFGLAQNGRLVVALRNEVVLFDPESGATELVAGVSHAKSGMRLNDGKVGPDGAFWVGSMDASSDGAPAGRLFRIGPDGSVRVVAQDIAISNGLAWNSAGTLMYHSDSRGGMWIDCWDFDRATGAIANRRRLRDNDEANGRPDGGACDLEGNYWSAGPSASRINRFSPTGELLDWVDVPLERPTMPCFGGADLKTVFVTSLESSVPDSRDGIVCFAVDVAGVPIGRFGR
jgi:sugar lactone lactonase YvrE